MTKKYHDLNCPHCGTPLGFIVQVQDMIDMADGDIGAPWMLNLWCNKCEDMTTSLFWEENGEAEEIEVPGLCAALDGADRLTINYPRDVEDA